MFQTLMDLLPLMMKMIQRQATSSPFSLHNSLFEVEESLGPQIPDELHPQAFSCEGLLSASSTLPLYLWFRIDSTSPTHVPGVTLSHPLKLHDSQKKKKQKKAWLMDATHWALSNLPLHPIIKNPSMCIIFTMWSVACLYLCLCLVLLTCGIHWCWLDTHRVEDIIFFQTICY